jgi:hypothetical protein
MAPSTPDLVWMQPTFAYPLFAVAAALLQLPWIFQLWPPIATVPFQVQAHLSEFSSPCWSYQAFSCGSVSISLSSWPDTFASAARPWLWPKIEGDCGSQPESPSRLKKKPNWTRIPLIVPELCHAQ